jgi:hypothetical protein
MTGPLRALIGYVLVVQCVARRLPSGHWPCRVGVTRMRMVRDLEKFENYPGVPVCRVYQEGAWRIEGRVPDEWYWVFRCIARQMFSASG